MLIRIFSLLYVLVAGLAIPVAGLQSLDGRAAKSNTALVDLTKTRGNANHLASGFIYGIPQNYNPNQIPDSFYSGINLQYGRAGGAQQPAPCRGWAFGHSEYPCRFQSTLVNYKQVRKFKAKFIILPHDIWGVDYRDSVSHYVWPGDNGDWTDYDAFLDQLIVDIKANNMQDGLVWDIWNEADGVFWNGNIQQWVDLYVRTHKRIRADSALNGVQISGPSHAGYPDLQNPWWTMWAQQISGNKTIPDQYSWHHEGGGDPAQSATQFAALRAKFSLPAKTININEYAVPDEFRPSSFAWYIARLERLGWYGLLGLWNPPLYDNFANLLTKSGDPQDPQNTNYQPASGWWVYNYYGRIQAGKPLVTTQSTDGNWDVYATLPAVGDNVRMLCGAHGASGTYYLEVSGMSSAGYATNGTVDVNYYRFEGTSNVFDIAAAPVHLGTATVGYTGNTVTIGVGIEDPNFAYGVEFVRKG